MRLSVRNACEREDHDLQFRALFVFTATNVRGGGFSSRPVVQSGVVLTGLRLVSIKSKCSPQLKDREAGRYSPPIVPGRGAGGYLVFRPLQLKDDLDTWKWLGNVAAERSSIFVRNSLIWWMSLAVRNTMSSGIIDSKSDIIQGTEMIPPGNSTDI